MFQMPLLTHVFFKLIFFLSWLGPSTTDCGSTSITYLLKQYLAFMHTYGRKCISKAGLHTGMSYVKVVLPAGGIVSVKYLCPLDRHPPYYVILSGNREVSWL